LSALGASSRAVDGLGSNSRTCRSVASLLCTRCMPRNVRYGVSVPFPARFRSRGSGCRSGWPSYSHGPASIDPFQAHSTAASLSLHRQALVLAVRGPAPRGASCDGPPAPLRLEQPSPWTSPISDVLRRHRGHRLAGSSTGGKLAGRTSCDVRLALTRAT